MRLLTARRTIAIVFLLSLAVFAVLLRGYEWTQIEAALEQGPQCPLRSWTGLKCAFCGMTHSWIAMLKGDWGRSVQENLLGPGVLGLTGVLAVRAAIRPAFSDWSRVHVRIAIGVLVAYALARNFLGP